MSLSRMWLGVAAYGALLALVMAFVGKSAGGQEKSGVPPQGRGLAAKYPGDVDIEKDRAVVFAENFEEGTLEELVQRWTDASNKGGKVMAVSANVPPASAGRRFLQMTATRGQNTGGHLFKVISPGQDRLRKIKEAMESLLEEAKANVDAKREEIRLKELSVQKEGKRHKGKKPKVPSDEPDPKAQRNFTDPESRIMKDGASKSFEQAYNCQVAVDEESKFIVATNIT